MKCKRATQGMVFFMGILISVLSVVTLFFITFGPTKNMKQTEKIELSDLRYYSRSFYMIIMNSLTFLIFVSGVMNIVIALVGKDWMCFLSYIIIGLTITMSVLVCAFFVYNHLSFHTSTNYNFDTLSHWEDIVCYFSKTSSARRLFL